jgi:hypothetical protein
VFNFTISSIELAIWVVSALVLALALTTIVDYLLYGRKKGNV